MHSGPDAGKAKRHHIRHDGFGPLGGLDPPQISAPSPAAPECRLMKPTEMANMTSVGSQPAPLSEDIAMAWKAPKIVEVSLALEINSYACAEIG